MFWNHIINIGGYKAEHKNGSDSSHRQIKFCTRVPCSHASLNQVINHQHFSQHPLMCLHQSGDSTHTQVHKHTQTQTHTHTHTHTHTMLLKPRTCHISSQGHISHLPRVQLNSTASNAESKALGMPRHDDRH